MFGEFVCSKKETLGAELWVFFSRVYVLSGLAVSMCTRSSTTGQEVDQLTIRTPTAGNPNLPQPTHTHTHRNTQRTLRSYNVPPSQRNEDGSVGCYLSERLPVSLPGLLSKQHQFLALLVPLVYCVDAGQQAHHQHEGDQAQHGQDGYSQGRQLSGWDGDKKKGNNHREKQLVTCDCRNQLLWCLATSSIRDLCSWMF